MGRGRAHLGVPGGKGRQQVGRGPGPDLVPPAAGEGVCGPDQQRCAVQAAAAEDGAEQPGRPVHGWVPVRTWFSLLSLAARVWLMTGPAFVSNSAESAAEEGPFPRRVFCLMHASVARVIHYLDLEFQSLPVSLNCTSVSLFSVLFAGLGL